MRARPIITMLIGLVAVGSVIAIPPSMAKAEATYVCLEDFVEEPCPEEVLATHTHLATPKKAILDIGFAPIIYIECNILFLGDNQEETNEPLVLAGKFIFTSCNYCTIKEESGTAELNVLRVDHELAQITSEFLVNILCPYPLSKNCNFTGLGLEFHSLGPLLATAANGEITASEQILNQESGNCSKESKISVVFEPLEPTFLASETTSEPSPRVSLCSKDEGSPFCKSENQLKSVDYKDKALEVLTNLGNVKCEGLASGAVGEPGSPLEATPALTFSNCGGGCFVTSVAGPGKLLLERTKSEEASATAEGFEIFVKCGTTIKCLLGPEKLTGTALGALTTGDNGRLTFSKASLGKGEGATCPKEATLDATYVASGATYIG